MTPELEPISIGPGYEAKIQTLEIPELGRVELLHSKGTATYLEDVLSIRRVNGATWILLLDGMSNVHYPATDNSKASPLIHIAGKSSGAAFVERINNWFLKLKDTVLTDEISPLQFAKAANIVGGNFLKSYGLEKEPESARPGAAGLVLKLSESGCEVCHWQDPLLLAWGLKERDKVALPNHHYQEELKRTEYFKEALALADEDINAGALNPEHRLQRAWAYYGPHLAKMRDKYQNNPEIPHSAVLNGSWTFPALTQTTSFSREEVQTWRGIVVGTDGGVFLDETEDPDQTAGSVFERIMSAGTPSLEAALKAKSDLEAVRKGSSHIAQPEWTAAMILLNQRTIE